MSRHSSPHPSDQATLRKLVELSARERARVARLLGEIGEVEARGLYRSEGYPSMLAYCESLNMDEPEAHICAARVAREYPSVFDAIADGRLHLAAVGLLAPFLTAENAVELFAAATHKGESEIEALLTERFPGATFPPQPVWDDDANN